MHQLLTGEAGTEQRLANTSQAFEQNVAAGDKQGEVKIEVGPDEGRTVIDRTPHFLEGDTDGPDRLIGATQRREFGGSRLDHLTKLDQLEQEIGRQMAGCVPGEK